MNRTTRNASNSSLIVIDSPSPLLRGAGWGEGSISGFTALMRVKKTSRLSMNRLYRPRPSSSKTASESRTRTRKRRDVNGHNARAEGGSP